MSVDDQEKPTKGTDPEAHIAIGKKRMFQVTDEATIRRLEKLAADLVESGQDGVGNPRGVEIMGPDQLDDRAAHKIDDETPTAR
ncbi:MAG: hypothetical protein A3F04_00155 [Candidatus Chisholmbacteria bacterium RIFCSPHIGHO2_12_FULL_49_9]|uniref:Uncharacterized protein n=1 Tax=Candidatus Chisholmbacteria bacterium RIFCSPHIGHO2_01_FULL_52_32 TaxID=1797591 RepID=A0A1G1VS93_9BACT|nr:MAG: hypothetical protein A2786_01995 [Candidatus Chisholmbacteria bacterium RIFCSPHIGHO2_01_FULL_52_32]OGY19128.1 MAG: hypothetical protein A3F04_00155 [Candidatus Chisholmbacteria bacterium RIFCSPHIGHO2_12_FULL_49_9]OGY20356.1 MAG: hypothetical protein A2900_04750 [Candidatus Chisholmbacteria bacterium RIFCSPLOWO2_01_FULL_50_28]